jgi:hypothetical protein
MVTSGFSRICPTGQKVGMTPVTLTLSARHAPMNPIASHAPARLGPAETARRPTINNDAPSPWTSGDVRWQARGCGYPATPFRRRMIEGEQQWCAALAAATPSEVQALHAALARVEASATGSEPSRRTASSAASVRATDPWDGYRRVPARPAEFEIVVEALQHVRQLRLRLPAI